MDYRKTGLEVLEAVGGKDNVAMLTHCATRLRFGFRDKGKVDRERVEAIPGVISVVDKGGQFQVVIGNEVQTAYRAIKEITGEGQGGGSQPDGSHAGGSAEKEKWLTRIISIISTTFTPVIPALVGGGMIKAVLAVLTLMNLVNTDGSTYQMLNMISDGAFYFMPVLLAYGAAIKFECSPILAMTLACTLLHPTWSGMLSAGAPITFFGIPVILSDYSYSVLPIIFTVWIMSHVERFAEKVSPSMIKFFTKPLITLFVTAPIAFLLVGPIGVFLNDVIAAGAEFINGKASWLIPALMGALQPVLVVSGTAWAMTPIATMQLTKTGSEMINGPGMLASNVAQGGATLAVALKTKNQELKQLATSTGITAVLGITEPSLYGVTLKLKRPLIASMIGGGIAGIYAGLSGLVRYAFVSPGLAALPAFIGENPMNIVHAVITCVIAFAAAFAAAWVMGFEEPEGNGKEGKGGTEESPSVKAAAGQKAFSIQSPVSGRAVPLSEVRDAVFSSGVLGKGMAVIPTGDTIVSPVKGRITAFFETKHAIGITCENGVEVLIHIGIDTVNLQGKHFTALASVDDLVEPGTPLVKIERQAILDLGYDLVTPVLVVNNGSLSEVLTTQPRDVEAGMELMKLC
ncbi:beta-glucoside-specific PTS transporter subunit IIABC [Enterocloster sp. OA13]|uniref:beta-glucoside-specific PTS transporter subunit IIABC n=1 Tax=Enterocloster sp. OA13 TaxID=2914161 RepID=UPI00046FFBCA|nr:beta-glucoside-specific PTS transporter subunit IIABC [Enterocloster sp. OA13]